MKIQIQIKNVYGKESIYPVCEISKNLAKLAGTITLTQEAIKIIKDLGYAIEIKQPEFSI